MLPTHIQISSFTSSCQLPLCSYEHQRGQGAERPWQRLIIWPIHFTTTCLMFREHVVPIKINLRHNADMHNLCTNKMSETCSVVTCKPLPPSPVTLGFVLTAVSQISLWRLIYSLAALFMKRQKCLGSTLQDTWKKTFLLDLHSFKSWCKFEL